MTVLFLPVQTDEVVRYVYSWPGGIVIFWIPVPAYTVQPVSILEGIINNFFYGVPVHVSFVYFYVVFLDFTFYVELAILNLANFVGLDFRYQ